ncbi:hypothetical protein GQ43DRAFT_32747 [Delitschia confertaspora ATCC 74209]|uniref:Uncharacterized protein n=1 Tax=Delitschia confertaspora ATCC 74209 TaxID=1513339 RepID=A0A9P4JS35_9PLEO|nr:hypothetical protein GQ43DRAFT_32747 [Delitschia confertaspora ATCC 74209]
MLSSNLARTKARPQINHPVSDKFTHLQDRLQVSTPEESLFGPHMHASSVTNTTSGPGLGLRPDTCTASKQSVCPCLYQTAVSLWKLHPKCDYPHVLGPNTCTRGPGFTSMYLAKCCPSWVLYMNNPHINSPNYPSPSLLHWYPVLSPLPAIPQ